MNMSLLKWLYSKNHDIEEDLNCYYIYIICILSHCNKKFKDSISIKYQNQNILLHTTLK